MLLTISSSRPAIGCTISQNWTSCNSVSFRGTACAIYRRFSHKWNVNFKGIAMVGPVSPHKPINFKILGSGLV